MQDRSQGAPSQRWRGTNPRQWAGVSLQRWNLLAVAAALALSALGMSCGLGSGPLPTPSHPAPTPSPTPAGTVRTALISVTVLAEEDQPPRRVARIEPRPGRVSILSGEEVQLEAVPFDQMGQAFREAPVRWSTLDPRAGHVTPGGRFRAGDAAGTYQAALEVTAVQPLDEAGGSITTGPVSAPVTVEVLPAPQEQPRLANLRVVPSPVVAQPRQIVSLAALATDQEGLPIAGEASWTLTDSSLGRINSLGYLTVTASPGLHPSALQVTFRSGDEILTKLVDLQVVTAPVQGRILSVNVLPEQVRLRPNEAFQFRALALDTTGQVLSSAAIGWTVHDPQAGSVTQDGRFQAGAAPGVYANALEVTATVRTEAGTSRQASFATIVIQEPPAQPRLASVSITPSATAVQPGGSVVFAATALGENGQPIPVDSLRWSLEASDVGTISSDGLFRALGTPGRYPGAVAVAAAQTVAGESLQATSVADVVIIGPMTTVEVQPGSVTVGVGESQRLQVKGRDANGAEVQGMVVQWEMADPAAGAINNAGVFTASQTPGVYPNAIRVRVRDAP